MAEDDFGVALEVEIKGTTFGTDDEFRVAIKDDINGETLVEKTFSNISDNKFYLLLTEEDSVKLPVGNYVYLLDWYRSGVLMYNIIPSALWRVVEKA